MNREIDLEPLRAPLRRFCLGYLDDAEAADDAVQELFRKFLAEQTPPRESLAWLRRAARNHCLNLLRTKRRRRDREPLPTSLDAAAPWTGPLTKLLDGERRDRVAELLLSLSDDERELLRLRYAEELSREEIAELLELPAAVVKSRLFEAIEKLRARPLP